jgi:hypothetical protein
MSAARKKKPSLDDLYKLIKTASTENYLFSANTNTVMVKKNEKDVKEFVISKIPQSNKKYNENFFKKFLKK